ncbi:methyltransferase domain-containing protein [Allosphingosinicella flava]|uniref:Methyltransferase domain-containing protein n=1 Tax=Allosphingosinicella flava TaxID=2771430 RepID=A0A7T2GIZ3_9SPHN|nr:methyltransferase domain-containing protein [Sphingosinicella flava]QPQ54602.1 methyltransferase domain-containing protein [Sphingosinicella flava]
MSYVLEHPDEARRLEQQALLSAYDMQGEVRDINLLPGEALIDLGCGSGLLSRELQRKFPHATIEGCDGSEQRLAQAKALLPAENAVHFFLSPLENIATDANRYEWAVARYVFEHLKNPVACAREVLRVLKPGGKLLAVDFDGLMFNLFPISPELNQMRQSLLKALPVNLYIGRELPSILHEAGFQNIKWSVEAHSFQGADLDAEKAIIEQRIRLAAPALEEVLGVAGAQHFEKEYLTHLGQPGATLFYNKFKVLGTKG